MRLVRLRARQRARQDRLTWPAWRARPGPQGLWLLSLCFCAGCGAAYRAAGADPAKLAAQVRAAADGAAPLPGDAAAVLGQTREAASARLLSDVLAAARAAAPGRPVLVHSAPDPRAVGANPGYDPAVLCGPGGADGIVLACGNPASAADLVARTAAAAPPGARIAAVLQAVAGLGGHPATLPAQAAAVRSAGATELRLYHAGLAAPGDLAPIRALCQGPPSAGRAGPCLAGCSRHRPLASRAGRHGGGRAGTAARRRCARRSGACSSRRCCRAPRIGSRCIWCTTPFRPALARVRYR